jgi:hypothetical protein
MRANLTHNEDGYSITSVRQPGGANRKPRARCIALTDCVCTDTDGNVTKIIPRTHNPRTAKSRARAPRTTTITSAARRDILLQAAMGSNHDPNE